MKGIIILTVLSALLCLAVAEEDTGISVRHQHLCLGKDGALLPLLGSCTRYIICVKGTAIIQTCGDYHFNAQRGACDHPSRAGCVSFGPGLTNVCTGRMNGVKLPIPGSNSNYYLCMNDKAIPLACDSPSQFDENTMQCIDVVIAKPSITPCAGVANGNRIPVEGGNPRQYYLCMNNKAFLKDCGNMYFNREHSACALQQEEKKAPAVIIPAQELPDQHNPLMQKLCRNQRRGTRIASPGSCSEYVICMGLAAIPKSCGQNQFNPISRLCDVPSNVRCSVKATGTVYGTQNTTQFHPVSKEPSAMVQICNGKRDGLFVAAPEKCSDFYFCYKNQSYRKTCGPTRHFSPIILACVELDESNCVDAAAPAIVKKPAVQLNSCLLRDNGALLRHPTDCGKFLVCDNNVPVEMNCPAGLHFSFERNLCDWPEAAKCFL